MNKEQIIAAIKECAGELGRAPSLAEFRENKGVKIRPIKLNFGS